MEKRKRIAVILPVCLAIVIVLVGIGSIAERQLQTIQYSCDVGNRQLSAVNLEVPPGEYDVLMQNTSGSGATDVLVGYGQSESCTWFDKTDAATEWQQIGSLQVDSSEKAFVQLGGIGSMEYGHINVILSPVDSSVLCKGRLDCVYQEGNRQLEVTPDRQFAADFVLSASVLRNPVQDELLRVDIYDRDSYQKVGEAGKFSDQAGDGAQVGRYESGQVATYRSDSNDESGIVRDARAQFIPGMIVGLLGLAFLAYVAVHALSSQREQRKFMRQRELYLEDEIWNSERSARVAAYAKLAASATVLMIGCLVLVRVFVLDITTINGNSMEPNVNDGQVHMVNKTPITIQNALMNESSIARGDAVYIDRHQLEPTGRMTGDLIYKRVVALAGDTVRLDESGLHVMSATGRGVNVDDQLGDDVVTIQMDYVPIEMIVPEGTVYVLGDNRPSSIDSRQLGPIPVRYIVGTE